MDIKYLFGWAEEEGVDLPTKADGSTNVNELFEIYNKRRGKRSTTSEKLSGIGGYGKIKLTKQEWAQYYRFVNDPQNKGAVFKGKKGETYVRLETKIVIKQYGKFSVKSFRDNDTMNDFLNS